jgi:hypothetical protein
MKKFEAISLLSQVIIQPDELIIIGDYIDSLKDDRVLQEDFFAYCLQWKLAPWIFTQLVRNNFQTNLLPEILEKFKAVYEKIELENKARNSEAVKFLKEFERNGIEVIILKGNLFAHTIYKDLGYKKMNDFDILIHPKDWIKAQEIYFELGFIPLGFGWSGEKQKPARFSHTGIPFISSNLKCIIGTQWGLKSPTSGYNVNIEDAWKTSLEFDFYGIPCRQLSPEYNLLHLILHMGIYKCGVRDCMDVYNLIISHEMDQKALVELFSESKSNDKAAFTLAMSNICSKNNSSELIDSIEKKQNSFIGRRLKKRMKMINETRDIHGSYNDYFQDIEKNVLYFNIVNKFHQKGYFYLKILRQIYFPETALTLKFIDKSHKPSAINKLKGRLKGPWFSFSMIAQEIGWKVTMLLFTKLFVDLTISTIYYIVPKEDYFDYLEKKGIDPKTIKKAVANVQ